MVLTRINILEEIQNGLVISPLQQDQIQPASVDLTLSHQLAKVSQSQFEIDVRIPTGYTTIDLSTKYSYPLKGHNFVLGSTEQYIEIPNHLCAKIEGRSSIGRLGLFIQNAGWVDPGFKGTITLEIFNANPSTAIHLYPGMPIGQIIFQYLKEPVIRGYDGKYQNQQGVTASRSYWDFESNQ